jgi:hypothetical protein
MLACTVLLTVSSYAAAVGLSSGSSGVGVGAASEQLMTALLLRGTTDYRCCVQLRRAAKVCVHTALNLYAVFVIVLPSHSAAALRNVTASKEMCVFACTSSKYAYANVSWST